jgi:2-iminobutanoate/2-iminopropanoate deaminase
MPKKAIQTAGAPKAIGPYSQAVRSGRLVFCSGQLGLVPDSGVMVAGGVRAQAQQAMDNLRAVLAAADASWADVVKTTIYLTDLNDFDAVNAVYGEFVQGVAPARATVQVAALPKGAAVEIEAVAHLEREP